jgi:hypothetical protein
MITLTKDRLEQLADEKTICKVSWDERIELARIALASLEAAGKPVLNVLFKNGWPVDGTIGIISGSPNFPDGFHDFYATPQPAPVVVPDGLRLALSNAGIAAPESDEMLAATCEKQVQALVTWVKDRRPFQPAAVVPDRSIFEKWWESRNGAPLDGWDSLRTNDGYCDDGIDSQFEAWSAAMLAAAPQEVKGE